MSQVGGRWQCLGWSLLPPFPFLTWCGGYRQPGEEKVSCDNPQRKGKRKDPQGPATPP